MLDQCRSIKCLGTGNEMKYAPFAVNYTLLAPPVGRNLQNDLLLGSETTILLPLSIMPLALSPAVTLKSQSLVPEYDDAMSDTTKASSVYDADSINGRFGPAQSEGRSMHSNSTSVDREFILKDLHGRVINNTNEARGFSRSVGHGPARLGSARPRLAISGRSSKPSASARLPVAAALGRIGGHALFASERRLVSELTFLGPSFVLTFIPQNTYYMIDVVLGAFGTPKTSRRSLLEGSERSMTPQRPRTAQPRGFRPRNQSRSPKPQARLCTA